MAVDFFLKLDGIDGESQDKDHKNEIKVLSWSYGGTQTSSVGGTSGTGAGKVDLSHLSIMKYYDKASPKLFKALVSGTHIKTGTLFAMKAGGGSKPFLKLDFEELYIASLQFSGSSEIPTESVSFSYNKIKVDYSTQNSDGNLVAVGPVSYDLSQNQVS